MVDLSVVIVNYNTKTLTLNCLKSITESKIVCSNEIWLVDNGSSDRSVKAVKLLFPNVKVIESKKNLGFAGGNNLAIRKSKGRYLLLLNSDTEITSGSLDKLVKFMDGSDFVICSCLTKDGDGLLQPNSGDLPSLAAVFVWLAGLDDILKGLRKYLPSFHRNEKEYYLGNKEVGWVSGSVMMIKRQLVAEIGLLDDSIFMYGEDVEYCLRASKAGYKIGWTDEVEVKHFGGGSSEDPKYKQWVGEFKGLQYLYKKYYGLIPVLLFKLLVYIFIFIRIIVFLLTHKFKIAKIYGKVITSI
ncbi:glycosyltransferase family 2 protein [Candidatus Parcubacteria bacterium]|nr:MAG: glycosyltransferase family 2 protein [Candidatus Parcubacteria bacterium]